jgi:hypothetical protein
MSCHKHSRRGTGWSRATAKVRIAVTAAIAKKKM